MRESIVDINMNSDHVVMNSICIIWTCIKASPFLLFPPSSLYSYSERWSCESNFRVLVLNRPAEGKTIKASLRSTTHKRPGRKTQQSWVLFLYFNKKEMNKNEFICQLFKDMSVLVLTRSRDWKRFRIKRDWTVVFYDRSEFFIIW